MSHIFRIVAQAIPAASATPTNDAVVSTTGAIVLSDKILPRKLALIALAFMLVVSTMCFPIASEIPQAQADTLVVAIDPGHGGSDPGAIGNGVREADANWAIAQACVNELRTYAGVQVVLTQDNTVNLTRKDRIESAMNQGADIVVSMHCNSVEGASSANGSEVWIPNNSPYMYNEAHVVGTNLGKIVLKHLSALGLNNRGLKTRSYEGESYPEPGGFIDYLGINLYPRYYGVCGIIIEHAFVSNASDAAKLASPEWLTKMGKADAAAIAEYYGLSKTPADSSETTGGATGSGLQKVGEKVSTPVVTSYEDNVAIMGNPKVTVNRMVEWYESKGKTFPASTYKQYGASTIKEFCEILYEEAVYEGVRPEVVFAQAMKETGYFRFGGQVKDYQCNFCGLGATDGGAAGADFSGYGKNAVRIGLRAQVQHLKAYACKDKLNRTGEDACVDPRFKYVTRGIAPTVKDLTGRWATASNYGDTLVVLINEVIGASQSSAASTNVKLSLADIPRALVGGSTATVYVDGEAATMNIADGYGVVAIEGTQPHSVVMYEYNTADVSDPHAVYPTNMHAWIITCENGMYTAKRYYGFDGLMQYAGSSIRITGNKGIRMITGITEQAKDALTGSGIAGYTVVETGTLLAWSDRLHESSDSLTFDTPGVSRGKAYVKGQKDPIFSTSGGVEYYTNVLVGFSTVEQYKRDMAMRSYIILTDAKGNKVTIYGGTLHRSIEYIAQQNADSFAAGTDAYNYVHSIINACKG